MNKEGDRVYSGQACTDNLTFGERKEHEALCLWSIVPCPNSEQCGTLLARDVAEHLLACSQAACENSKYGCEYRGKRSQVEQHSGDCKFVVVKGVVETFKSTVDTLVLEVSAFISGFICITVLCRQLQF